MSTLREDLDSLFKWVFILAGIGILGAIGGAGYGIYKLVIFLMN